MFAALKRMLTRARHASNATAGQSNNNRAVVKTEPNDESMDGTSEGPPKWYGAAVPRGESLQGLLVNELIRTNERRTFNATARKVKSTKGAEGKRKKVAKKKTVAAKKTKVEKKPAPKKSKKSTKKVKGEEEEEEEETSKSTKKVKKKKKKKEEEETPGLIVKIAGTSFRNSNCVKAIKVRGCECRSNNFERARVLEIDVQC